jgi:cytoskeletal protein RodZ
MLVVVAIFFPCPGNTPMDDLMLLYGLVLAALVWKVFLSAPPAAEGFETSALAEDEAAVEEAALVPDATPAAPTVKTAATAAAPTVKTAATAAAPTVKTAATAAAPTAETAAAPTAETAAAPTVKTAAAPTVKTAATPTVKTAATPTVTTAVQTAATVVAQGVQPPVAEPPVADAPPAAYNDAPVETGDGPMLFSFDAAPEPMPYGDGEDAPRPCAQALPMR